MAVDLKNHPGVNPHYFDQMERRLDAIRENRLQGFKAGSVPKPPNKYVPHIGAKQRAKTANWPDGRMHWPSKAR